MATTVYNVEEVLLQDGKTVELKPLNIKGQKKFMQIMKTFPEAKNEEETMEVLLLAGAVCLMKQVPEYWDKSLNDGSGGYTDAYEEAMDQQTLIKVLDSCGGTNFGDPKLREAAERALLGTT